jgi:hypothetical protein
LFLDFIQEHWRGARRWNVEWRDNHLIELGVAAQANAIVTRNLRDMRWRELKLPPVRHREERSDVAISRRLNPTLSRLEIASLRSQ